MITYLRFLSNKLGVDRAIAYTVLSRGIQAGGGVISILFIARELNKVEQGYYYTFGSILAIQIFFELGLSNIITQYVAHEMSNLEWKNEIQITGSKVSLSRLSSLLNFCVKWFSAMAVVLILVLLVVGYVFFSKYGGKNEGINWEVPWIILVITTGCSLLVSPILAFFEGLNKVKEVAIIRLIQQVSQLLLLIIFLNIGFRLFSSPLASILALFVTPCWIFFSRKKKILQNIWKQLGDVRVNYKIEIFPFQWRIALSWISGYFIFQLFNPVLFATEGPEVAGRMGMTLVALNGVLSISMSWINTKVPIFSNLIAKREFKSLDIIFNQVVKQACLICLICLVILIMVVSGLQYFKNPIGNRFLPLLPMIMLCVATFANQFIAALGIYLRCHKQEPFLIQSLVVGVLIAASTFIFGYLFGLNGITIGYSLIVVCVSLVWSLAIFRKKKLLWHS